MPVLAPRLSPVMRRLSSASSATRLHTFLPISTPSTRISAFMTKSPQFSGEHTLPEGGAGHSINFPARLEDIARQKGVGSPTRRVSVKKTRSRGAGPNAVHGPLRPRINARSPPTFSARPSSGNPEGARDASDRHGVPMLEDLSREAISDVRDSRLAACP